MSEKYRLGKSIKMWSERAQTVSFVVTEDCNLRCKYCYITHKASNKVLALDTAKKFIDYLFTDAVHKQEAIALEFIGGEPCIEMHLIDQICDYFKLKAYIEGSDWYWNYRISICTNGVNYGSDEVQQFIKKNHGKISMTISIDGTKAKHDAQRVFPNGEGSYDIISKYIPLYISQFGGHTKATFSRDDLPTLKESIVALWNMGITEVASNVIFEDVWQDGDDVLLEQQLKELADYALDNHLFDKYICTFFEENIGYYYSKEDLTKTWCGAGKMLALGPNGNIYPCIRYKDYSLNKHEERIFGSINDGGIDMDLVRPFLLAQNQFQSDEECLNCPIATGCAFCQGFNYDEAEIPTNLFRAKYICPMHKARVRANDYYFSKLFNRYGIEKKEAGKPYRELYFLLADDYLDYCQFSNTMLPSKVMTSDNIIEGLRFARENFFRPVFVHSKSRPYLENPPEFDDYHIRHIIPAAHYKYSQKFRDCLLVFEVDDCDLPIFGLESCQLNISSHEIQHLYECVVKLLRKAKKIKINILDLDKTFDESSYKEQLKSIADYLHSIDPRHEFYGVDLLETYIAEATKFVSEHRGCVAGDRSFAYAPDGHLYICAEHYSEGQDVGSIKEGIVRLKYSHLYKLKNKPLCSTCDAYQCSKCMVVNEKYTKERTISPAFQCHKGMIEKEIAVYYASLKGLAIQSTPTTDPIAEVIEHNSSNIGIYKF
ncbi:radical SAM peptide maturase, CXXX-repeat target family [Flavonifractor plautii]|uniref:radical SAM peptide maturase, CXXX-repeat target family n=1 Tax=Flavonifractor plautii TaxID=292800 RepID=UPI000B3A7CC2|nr:radical SAM peptide maturase, CXXX-repeat target family [Flavonifractor plautii]OUO82254.1 radical SAM peptide maturase, CXXX-repeat target family [Flavonifractor plautii]